MVVAMVVALVVSSAGPAGAETVPPLPTLDVQAVQAMIQETVDSDPVLFTVMAAWCHPCVKELPLLNRLYGRYRDRGLRIVGLAIDYNGPGAMAPILRRLDIDFPVFWVGEALVSAYTLTAIPVLFVADDGHIVERIQGMQSLKSLESHILELLQEP